MKDLTYRWGVYRNSEISLLHYIPDWLLQSEHLGGLLRLVSSSFWSAPALFGALWPRFGTAQTKPPRWSPPLCADPSTKNGLAGWPAGRRLPLQGVPDSSVVAPIAMATKTALASRNPLSLPIYLYIYLSIWRNSLEWYNPLIVHNTLCPITHIISATSI